MKITTELVQPTGIMSFSIPSSLDRMCKEVATTSKCQVHIHGVSKTRFSVAFQAGMDHLSFNTLPKAFCSEPSSYGLKMHLEAKTNMWSGDRVTVAYFVKSKKQGWEALRQHIIDLFTDYIAPKLPQVEGEVVLQVIADRHFQAVNS